MAKKKAAQLQREIDDALDKRRGSRAHATRSRAEFLPLDVIEELENRELPYGWQASWEYPGFVDFTHAASDFEVVMGEDGGDVLVQVQTRDGRSINDGEVIPIGPGDWTAGAVIELARPWLEKYRP